MVIVLGGRIQKLTLQAQTQVGVLAAGVARAIPGIRTIRAAGATDREIRSLDEQATNAYGTGVRLAKVMALIAPIMGIAFQAAFIGVLGIGGYRVASGEMTVADLVAFLLYLFMMIMPLGEIFNAYTAVQNALGAVLRIREITALAEEDDAASTDRQPDGRRPRGRRRTRCSPSTGSASATPTRRSCTRSASRCRPAAAPRSSAPPGPASRRSWP